jgi:hypothetical protein
MLAGMPISKAANQAVAGLAYKPRIRPLIAPITPPVVAPLVAHRYRDQRRNSAGRRTATRGEPEGARLAGAPCSPVARGTDARCVWDPGGRQ